jgi:acyl-CoA synthetase (AMP-forming)/AMP-acid ligase II
MSYTVGEMLIKSACAFPDKIAVICNDRQVTYRELNARVNQLTHGLLQSDITGSSRVAILMYNSIEFIEICFALAKLGSVGIPLNFRLTGPELSSIIEHSDARILLMGEEFEPIINQIRTRLPKVKQFITVNKNPHETDEYHHLFYNQSDSEPGIKVKPEDESFVIYTSGTTGKPKGVILTHQNHYWNTANYTIAYQMNEDDVELALTPMFHSSTLGRVFTYIFTGATFITSPRFDPAHAMELIAQHKVTSITQSPTMYAALLQLPQKDSSRTSFVKRVVSGAAPISPEMKEELAKLFPHAGIFDLYGLTEASPGVTILTPHDPPEKINSVGKPMLSVKIKVVDEAGEELPPGENGEIICRGPNLMKGYYNNDVATQEVLKDGWLYTGDVGKFDQDGYLYLTGRKKEIIISGGENIYPAEVEAVLEKHPLILEAAVIGVPDGYWGESVKAVVVPKPGKTLTDQEVIEYCKSHLAHYKKPRSVDFMDALPRNAANKVMKTELFKRDLSK